MALKGSIIQNGVLQLENFSLVAFCSTPEAQLNLLTHLDDNNIIQIISIPQYPQPKAKAFKNESNFWLTSRVKSGLSLPSEPIVDTGTLFTQGEQRSHEIVSYGELRARD